MRRITDSLGLQINFMTFFPYSYFFLGFFNKE